MTSVVFVAQCMDKTHTEDAKTVEYLLDRNIELSLFIVSSSLVIPRFISNIEIRHSYFWLYFVPIIIIIFFFFGSYFNFSDVYGIMVE